MTYSCTGECNTCSVDHSQDNITTNRGHGISYSPKVREYVFKTDFLNRDEQMNQILVENIDERIYTGQWGSAACGDIVNIWVKLDSNYNTILDAKYLSTGCWGSLSSSAYGCEKIIGKELFDLNLQQLTLDIINELDLPQIKKHCSVFIGNCLEQIRNQVSNKINSIL